MSEFTGIIKNGIQRGWPIQEIYQSLVNSGYNPQEVQSEINKFSNPVSNLPIGSQNQQTAQKLAPYQLPAPQEKKSAGKSLVIALVVLAILVVIAGASFILFGSK